MASKLHQLEKAIVTKTHKLGSVLGPYFVEEENLLPQVFSELRRCAMTSV